MKNSIGRELPELIGTKPVRPFQGAFALEPPERKAARYRRFMRKTDSKVLHGLNEAFDAAGVKSGMTLGFHHCFRDGDRLVNQVLDLCAQRGIGDLRLFATALFPVHAPLLEHVRSGVISRIEGSMNGPVGEYVSKGGVLKSPCVLRSHGGRWRAVETGEVEIDVAFIAAPQADALGNATGIKGKTPCGPLGYSPVDAQYAKKTIVVTNDLAPYPVHPFEVQQAWVDHVCVVDEIGNPEEITSGTLAITTSPTRLRIAKLAALAVRHSQYFKEGISFQGGAGGISLAATKFLGDELDKAGLHASFVIGGVTALLVDQLRRGTVRCLLDGQAFDLAAVESLNRDPGHCIMDIGMYANYDAAGCSTYMLDAAFLGATEVDVDFNVNVNTHSDGKLLHGIGGHQDVSAGTRMNIITTPLLRGRLPIIVDRVTSVTTPGECVDVVATEVGLAVNPKREDLLDRLKRAGLPLFTMEELKAEAERLIQPAAKPVFGDEIIGAIQWRDGSVIDVVRKVEGWR